MPYCAETGDLDVIVSPFVAGESSLQPAFAAAADEGESKGRELPPTGGMPYRRLAVLINPISGKAQVRLPCYLHSCPLAVVFVSQQDTNAPLPHVYSHREYSYTGNG